MTFSVNQAAAFLLGCDGYLIYTHASPDGDTLGSAGALALILRSLGKKAFVFAPDGVPDKLRFLYNKELFIDQEPKDMADYTPISVDVAGPKLLGRALNRRFALSIDHHKLNTLDCENLLCQSERIACGEIIFLLAKELSVKIDKDIAHYLYTAICSDSGGFRYDSTTAETHRIAAELHETGIDFAGINRRLFESKSRSQVALIKTAYKNLELLCEGRFAIVAISPEEVEECEAEETDFDCINPIPREIAGIEASAVIRQKPDGVKVSLRSNTGIDVSEIARNYGGGGHYHAAGLTLDCDFNEAVNEVRKIFSELNK